MTTKPVMKSLRLNPENALHKKAIDTLSEHGKNSQALIVMLLIEYGEKMKINKNGGVSQ